MATKRRNISSSRKHFNKSRKMRGGAYGVSAPKRGPRYESLKKIRNIPHYQSTITKSRIGGIGGIGGIGSSKKINNATSTSPLISRFTKQEPQPQGTTPFGREFLLKYSPNLVAQYNQEMK